MNSQKVLESLRKYNEDERFYQSYYIARRDPQMLKIFLDSYSRQELLKRKLIVPDLDGMWYPQDMRESCFEPDYLKQCVAIMKHNRFTPVFEHFHTFYELVYVLEGQCEEVINGRAVTMKKGDFSLVPPGVHHSISVFDDSVILNTLIWKQNFSNVCHNLLHDHNPASDFLNRTLDPEHPGGFILFQARNDQDIENLMLEMIGHYEKGKEGQDLLLSAQLLYLFSRLIRDHQDGIQIFEEGSQLSETGKQIQSCIDRSFRTLTLSALAEKLGFSTGYCSRLIRKEFGSSFTDLILERKFSVCQEMLKTTTLPISRISESSGFESVEHFNRMFKKKFGCTPGQWRKKAGNPA